MNNPGPVAKKPPRSLVACYHCRKRKMKCITTEQPPTNPCANCIKKNLQCEYIAVDSEDRSESAARFGKDSTLSAPTFSTDQPPVCASGQPANRMMYPSFEHYPASATDGYLPGTIPSFEPPPFYTFPQSDPSFHPTALPGSVNYAFGLEPDPRLYSSNSLNADPSHVALSTTGSSFPTNQGEPTDHLWMQGYRS
ncbi:C6 finger domain [Mycena sanguinolenta]|uniref:C6 finger domain n=1 Tax=Mycena sanguinolenta TaxID=230812 RepID=A0A8H6YI80_9AGAR|nr:C6 finger domain [Mycena sanguinolenta]